MAKAQIEKKRIASEILFTYFLLLIACVVVAYALATQGCARDMLEVYSAACRETLALPTVMGVKSPKERYDAI